MNLISSSHGGDVHLLMAAGGWRPIDNAVNVIAYLSSMGVEQEARPFSAVHVSDF